MVMGAVRSGPTNDPLLVMKYLAHGLLYDILHNSTTSLEADVLLPILRDISQVILFLHTANPQCIHADGTLDVCGTPVFLLQSSCLKKNNYSAASVVYAVGIMHYDIYSRRDPYDASRGIIATLQRVTDPSIQLRPSIPPTCPSKIASLMKDLLARGSRDAPTYAGG